MRTWTRGWKPLAINHRPCRGEKTAQHQIMGPGAVRSLWIRALADLREVMDISGEYPAETGKILALLVPLASEHTERLRFPDTKERGPMTLAWCVLALVIAGTDDRPPAAKKAADTAASIADEAVEIWPLTERDTVGIAIEHSQSIHVIYAGHKNVVVPDCFGLNDPDIGRGEKRPIPDFANAGSIVVAPVDADTGIARTKSEIMALVRSVDTLYGNLAAAHAAAWAADKAVERSLELIEIEEAFGNRDCPEDLAELAGTCRRLAHFKKELVARTAGVIKAERQLRKVMGVAESGGRTLIPVTPSIDAPLVFAWGDLEWTLTAQTQSLIELKAFCRWPRESVIEALEAFDDTSPKPDLFPYGEDYEELARWFLAPRLPERSDGHRGCVSAGPGVPAWVFLRRENHDSPPAFDRAVVETTDCYQRYEKTKRLRMAAQERMEAQALLLVQAAHHSRSLSRRRGTIRLSLVGRAPSSGRLQFRHHRRERMPGHTAREREHHRSGPRPARNVSQL